MLRYRILQTPWGRFAFVASHRGLIATYLPARNNLLESTVADDWPEARPSNSLMPDFRAQILSYFRGQTKSFTVELDLTGVTEFRQDVIRACRKIPFGRMASYSDLARAVGRPAAVRAVGSTMANNRLPIVVPCHRVVRQDGSLGGFSATDGVRMKHRLLTHEGIRLELLPV